MVLLLDSFFSMRELSNYYLLVDVTKFVNNSIERRDFLLLKTESKKIPASLFACRFPSNDYFSEIAVTGHTPTQVKQEMQTSSLHPDFPFSSNESALTGQAPTQAPQPIHVSLSTVTGIFASFVFIIERFLLLCSMDARQK